MSVFFKAAKERLCAEKTTLLARLGRRGCRRADAKGRRLVVNYSPKVAIEFNDYVLIGTCPLAVSLLDAN